MKKLLLLLLILATIGIAAYALWEMSAPPPAATQETGEVQIGGAFTLKDQNGNMISDADFKGKLMLVYFGFTYCPDICPADISNMAQAMQQLGDKGGDVVPIFITIDPERDTETQLKSYLANFKPSIVGLTGDTKDAIKAYKIYAKKVPNGTDYTMDHSAFMYLMSRDGKYLAHFGHNTAPAEIAAKIREYL